MSSSLDAIRRVIAAFERSDWAEIDVRSGGVRVHLAAGLPSSLPASTQRLVPAHSSQDAVTGAADVPDQGSAAHPTAPLPAGAHVVVSPSPGICWRAPEPGAPLFVDLGDTVDESATVCIVEVMKLMSHLKAGVSGRVVAVYGENGVAVEKGQRLFAIAPSGTAS